MGDRIGGTPEQMQAMGTKFNSEADELQALVARVTGQLEATDWEGGAARAFRDQWNGEFRNTFQRVSDGLRACSAEVNARAHALVEAGGGPR